MHNSSLNRPRFQLSIKTLLILVALVAVALGLVGSEPLGIALASLYCFISWVGVSTLYFWSRGKGLQISFTLKSVALTLVIFAIVVSNYVLEHGVSTGRYLVTYGWIVGLGLGFLVFRNSNNVSEVGESV